MALDPKTHTIYMMCARYLSAPSPGPSGHARPRIEPGSVELLVLKHH
jgi:hypothetical protein